MKKIRLITTIVVIAISMTCFFYACQKENVTEIPVISNTEPLKRNEMGMVYFKDDDELLKVMDIVNSMDEIERIKYEKSNGFTSYGRLCDEIYDPSVAEDKEGFQTFEEVEAFVAANSEYVQLFKDYDGELLYVPHLFNNPYRYFITKDNRIFQLGESYIKVFESGTVTTDINNIDVLKNLKEEDLSSFYKGNDKFLCNFSNLNSGEGQKEAVNNYYFNEKRNGDDNERVRIECKRSWDLRPNLVADHWMVCDIRGFRKAAGVWNNVKRTIHYNFTTKYKFGPAGFTPILGYLPDITYNNDHHSYTGSNKTKNHTFNISRILGTLVDINYFYVSYSFYEISGYASIPAARCSF